MSWDISIFVGSALVLLCSLSALLYATISGEKTVSPPVSRLAIAGFALILAGAVAVDVRWNVYVRAGQFFLDDFGWLLIISGLVFLFILSCVNRTPVVVKNAANNGKQENAVGDYLR
jgi:hypothetical protein